jgi:hypothetical protein
MVFFGSAKRQNGALSSRFLRLVGYRFGPYPDFSDSFWKGNSAKFGRDKVPALQPTEPTWSSQ